MASQGLEAKMKPDNDPLSFPPLAQAQLQTSGQKPDGVATHSLDLQSIRPFSAGSCQPDLRSCASLAAVNGTPAVRPSVSWKRASPSQPQPICPAASSTTADRLKTLSNSVIPWLPTLSLSICSREVNQSLSLRPTITANPSPAIPPSLP